jgi:DNA (cytosine-5)-methyltransferase 1
MVNALGRRVTIDAGLPHNRDRVFIIGSNRSESAYQFFSYCSSSFGSTEKRRARRANLGHSFSEGAAIDAPVLVQRRGGFGYTRAQDYSPTVRAQTGGHQGGHSDRPILCSQELDVDRVRDTDGLSGRLDGRRGRLIGNAVAPPIAEWIARTILKVEQGDPLGEDNKTFQKMLLQVY